MDFERLVDLAEPLGPVGGAAPAPLVERQLQLAQQARHFLARRYMAEARAGAKRNLVEVVESGQPAREEFAVDDTLKPSIERKPSRNDSSLRPSATSCLLRDPSIDNRLRTTIQSVVAPSS